MGTDVATWLGRPGGRDIERKLRPGLGFGRGDEVATLFRGHDLGQPSGGRDLDLRSRPSLSC